MKKLITLTRSLLAAPAIIHRGRAFTRDVAFNYRMPAGFAGDVNRTHPASIEPGLPDVTNPPQFYGQCVTIDATSGNVRRIGVVDDSALTDIYGVAVRAYPIQQMTGGPAAAFGAGPVPTNQPVDILKSGYIMAPVNGVPKKGDQVFVWAKPAAGADLPGQFRTTASGGNAIALPLNSYSFNGGPDANGICEVIIRA